MRLHLFCVFFLLTACSQKSRFGFAVGDAAQLPELERRFYQPQRFVSYQRVPIFEEDDVLWFAYRPASPQPGAFYGISLQKKSLGYQEIDLRNRQLVPEQDLLIDHYRNLSPGEYRIKIAYQNRVIDQVDFIIVADSASEAIDFATDEPESAEF